MNAGDTLRAHDAVSFYVEEAAAQIRRAGVARIESYPGTSRKDFSASALRGEWMRTSGGGFDLFLAHD